MSDAYHHGDLRRALLDEAAQMVESEGPSSLSLRALARHVNVSHAAPAHHFHDRRGLLTALAAQGADMLAAQLSESLSTGFDEAAVAYVRFAREHPGYYAVMHQDDLLDVRDEALRAARTASREALVAGLAMVPRRRRPDLSDAEAAHVAWALVHGLAVLAARDPGGDPKAEDDLVRRAAQQLFG